MFHERRPFAAFHERDLEKILNKFALLEKMKNNALKCNICNTLITKENFGCIYLSKENKIDISCSNPECLEKVSLEI